MRESHCGVRHCPPDPYGAVKRDINSVAVVNGIKLQGQIESFDQYVVLLKNTVTQMVYKHAISTVVPARSVTMPHNAPAGDTEA